MHSPDSISLEEVRSRLRYEPETGHVYWIGGKFPGRRADTRLRDGYRYIIMNRRTYFAHRLIWLHAYGEWPQIIDHINGVGDDNRLENLRNVNHAINMQNLRRPTKVNKTGFLGVSAQKSGKFQANIVANGKFIYLGLFTTAQEAHQAYLEAKRVHHPGCTL